MDNYINVREVMGAVESRPPLFFDPVGPDRYAAMERKRILEQHFEAIYREINHTNTRGIPAETRQKWEAWTIATCQLLTEEENNIKGRTE